MNADLTVMLHYSAPPVVGGVEAVVAAHVRSFSAEGRRVSVVAGKGDAAAIAPYGGFHLIPEMDTQHPAVLRVTSALGRGEITEEFYQLADLLTEALRPALSPAVDVIVHNVFTKHFNLPLTVALSRLLDEGAVRHCIAWCHDFTWTSPNSRDQVRPGFPWDLLRTRLSGVDYVTVSESRRVDLTGLLACPAEDVKVVYNGVDAASLLGISDESARLIDRLGILDADLALLMPVRVTRAKNIEYAIRLVAAVRESGLRPRLVVTGPPDPHDEASMAYYQSLKNMRAELGLDREIRFVYEGGTEAEEPHLIDANVVGDLYRASDVMLMPSHREGFGMPILEAGLVGLAVAATGVPAAVEIGGDDVFLFDANEDPAVVVDNLLTWLEDNPVHRFRRRVRHDFTWAKIFRRDIAPILHTEMDQPDVA